MLRISSLRVDWGRLEALVDHLNRFQVAGYIDTSCSPWEWVQDNLLPLLPLSVTSGASGLFPVLWPYAATARDAVTTITAGAGVVRTSPVTYDRGRRDVVNEIRLSYALDGSDGALRVLTHTPEPDPAEAQQVTSLYAQVSGSRYGTIATETDTGIVWASTTAHGIASWMIRARGFPTRVVSYEVGLSLGWLRPGQVVLLTDADLHLTDQVCVLRERTYTDGGRLDLTLALIEDVARD